MLPYLFALFLVIIGIITHNRMSPSVKTVFYWGICMYVCVLMGVRYRVGVDTLNYMWGYDSTPDWNSFDFSGILDQRGEPAFLLAKIFCRSITPDFWLLQMLMALITNICIFIFIKRYCANIFVGIFFYFIVCALYFTTEIMRESAAVGIFLINFRNVEKKRWVRYYLLSFLSIAFHYSAIIIWAVPLVRYMKFNLWFIGLCVFFFLITPIIQELNTYITLASIQSRVTNSVNDAEKLNLNWRLANLILTSTMPVICLWIVKKYRWKLNDYFRGMLLAQILLCFGAFAIPIVFARFVNYTVLFSIVVFSNLLGIRKISQQTKIAVILIVFAIRGFDFYQKRHRWFPYESIFNEVRHEAREQLWRHEFIR